MAENIWAEPEEDVYVKIVDRRFETATVETDEGETINVEKIVVEAEDLTQDLDWNRTWYFTKSMHRRSKWSIWKNDFKKIGYPVESDKQLIGHFFHFKEKELDFGGGFVAPSYPEPAEHFSSRGACLEAAGEEGQAEGEGSGFSQAELAVLEYIDGVKFEEVLADVIQDSKVSADPDLMSVLLDEEKRANLFVTFQAADMLEIDEDGVCHVV